MFEDKTLICKECGKEFVFSVGEQERFAELGFENDPVRCYECRVARKKARNPKPERVFHDAICAECGGPARVPFEPKEDGRPVFCSACYAKKQENAE